MSLLAMIGFAVCAEAPAVADQAKFEFIADKINLRWFQIEAVSPDGSIIVGKTSSDFWMITPEGERKLNEIHDNSLEIVAVSDKEQILGNTNVNPVYPNYRKQGLLIDPSGEMRVVSTNRDTGTVSPFTAGGFALDGRLLGGTIRVLNGDPYAAIAVEAGNHPEILFTSPMKFMEGRLTGEIPGGYVGFLPDGKYEWSAQMNGKSRSFQMHSIGFPRAILYANDRVLPMELPEGYEYSMPAAVSDGGTFVAGTISGNGTATVVWQREALFAICKEGKSVLAFNPRGISADGSVVVGNVGDGFPNRPVIWTQSHGIESLSAFLLRMNVKVPVGAKLVEAAYVRKDGKVIIGCVEYPNYKRRIFRVTLPGAKMPSEDSKPPAVNEGSTPPPGVKASL